jgi:hypothetical protein
MVLIPRVNRYRWTTLACKATRLPCLSSRAEPFLYQRKTCAFTDVAAKRRIRFG